MNRILCRSAHVLAAIGLAMSCAWSRASNTFPTQVSGDDCVALESVRGLIEKVCLFGGTAHTVCIDGATGKVIWSVKAPGLSQQASPGAGPLLAAKTLVYMGGGGVFTAYGIDAETGKTEWKLDERSATLAAGPDTVFLGTQGGLSILAIDARTGKVKWENSEVKAGRPVTKMAYAGGQSVHGFTLGVGPFKNFKETGLPGTVLREARSIAKAQVQ